MAQQYSSMLFWICLFVTCCNVREITSVNATASNATAVSAGTTVPSAPVVSVNTANPGGSGSVSSGGTTSTVPNPATGTGVSSVSASSIKPGTGSTTPAAKVNCSEGTTTTADWSGSQNVSGSCQSSTCWVLATYAGDEVTQIKLSCAPKEQSTTCDKDECKYASGSCECCCSTESCNKENFDEKCEGARASSKGVRLSPPWLGLVALVLVMMKTM